MSEAYEIRVCMDIGSKTQYAMVIGKWSLAVPLQKTRNGYFTLLFENTKLGWKVIIDHSSMS